VMITGLDLGVELFIFLNFVAFFSCILMYIALG
jgi:hypothetical protein